MTLRLGTDAYWQHVLAKTDPAAVVSVAADRIRFAMANGVDGGMQMELTARLLEQLATALAQRSAHEPHTGEPNDQS